MENKLKLLKHILFFLNAKLIVLKVKAGKILYSAPIFNVCVGEDCGVPDLP